MSSPASTRRATPRSVQPSDRHQPIRVIAKLPQHGDSFSSFVRHDPASGRVVVHWYVGTLGGRTGADFVDLATGTVTPWGIDPVVVDRMRFGDPQPELLARWHREVLGEAPGPIVRIEYPNGESQVVQRDGDGAHPIVRDTQSFDAGELAQSSGAIAWRTYVRRFRAHALAIAPIADPTATPTYLRDVPQPKYLAWSDDGATLYGTSSEKLGDAVVLTGALLSTYRDCFVRIDVATSEVTPVRCTVQPETMSIAYDKKRTRAAIITTRRDGRVVDIELVALPSGEKLGALANVDTVGVGIGTYGALDSMGRLIIPGSVRGITVVDIAGAKAWYIDDQRGYFQITTAEQLDAERWFALGTNAQAGWDKRFPELVMIDLAAVTASPPRRLAPAPTGTPDPELPAHTAADRFWERATPCAAGQHLASRRAIAGTEHACLDRSGTRAGAFAVVDGDTWHVLGTYRSGKRHGTWTYYSHGTPILQMGLVAGQQQGLLRGWYRDGQRMFDVRMRSGVPDGPVSRWYPSGQLALVGTFANDAKVGSWREWYPSGVLASEASYANRKLVGLARAYRPNGVRREEVEWGPNQERLWERMYDEAGRLEREIGHPDKEHVIDRLYWPDGRLRMRGTYTADRANGSEEHWSEDGSVHETCVRNHKRTEGRCTP